VGATGDRASLTSYARGKDGFRQTAGREGHNFIRIYRIQKCRDLVRNATEYLGGAAELFGYNRAGQQRLNKWALKFMIYSMFVAGGQRPQVFRSLVVPEETELFAWQRQNQRAEISLHVPLENTPRSRECPAVQCTVRAARLIAFHVRKVLPFILTRYVAPRIRPRNQSSCCSRNPVVAFICNVTE
jgi:hypothetical protein